MTLRENGLPPLGYWHSEQRITVCTFPQAIFLMVGVQVTDRLGDGCGRTAFLDRMEHRAGVAALVGMKDGQGGDTGHPRVGYRSGSRDNLIRKVPAGHPIVVAVQTEVNGAATTFRCDSFIHDSLPVFPGAPKGALGTTPRR
jgi:hypothetical protein